MTDPKKPVKKQGRKKTEDYYKTKKPDSVDLTDCVIFLPIKLSDINHDLNLDMQIEIIKDCQEIQGYLPEQSTSYSNIEIQKPGDYNDTDQVFSDSTKEVYNIELKEKKYKIVCWWCCHQFEGEPIHCPVSLKRDIYKVKGYFCSFSCCYTYVKSEQNQSRYSYLVNYMFKDMTGKKGTIIDNVKPAPPRETLKIFGGFLDITEFRQTNDKFVIKPCVLSYEPTQIEMVKHRTIAPKIFKVLQPSKEKQKVVLAPNSLGKILGIKECS
jgi:hypothetical protein